MSDSGIRTFFYNISFFNSSDLNFESKIFFFQFLVDIFPLGSGSVDLHIFADPDPGSQMLQIQRIRILSTGYEGNYDLNIFLPRLIWFNDASILIIKEAGTVIVSFISSNITSFRLIETNSINQST